MGAIALALTNPSSEQYGQFAADTSQRLLQQEVCARFDPLNLQKLKPLCDRFSQQAGTQMEEWVLQSSDRRNFGLLSLYETRLSVRSLLQTSEVPDWSLEFTSIGALSGFNLLQVNWQTGPAVQAPPASEGKLKE